MNLMRIQLNHMISSLNEKDFIIHKQNNRIAELLKYQTLNNRNNQNFLSGNSGSGTYGYP